MIAIGRRAILTRGDGEPSSVELTEDKGQSVVASLPVGSEVEIIAWRPQAAGGSRYLVKGVKRQVEGWLSAARLRPVPPPPPPVRVAPIVPPVAKPAPVSRPTAKAVPKPASKVRSKPLPKPLPKAFPKTATRGRLGAAPQRAARARSR